MGKNTVLVITGPTASGKTEIGIKCANMFNGEIISADSMQIYKKLNIGTAKATEIEKKRAKHHMLDVIDPDKSYSVQEFVNETKQIIDNLFMQDKLPIIVGGTGLYIKSLLYPYSFCNVNKNDEVREKYNNILKTYGKEYLYNLLKTNDPKSCEKIHMNDTKRVIRALEIFEVSGQEKTKLNDIDFNNGNFKDLNYNCIFIVLDIPREELYNRINLRVEKMFEAGLLDEVKTLLAENIVSEDCQSMQAIGYKEFFKYFKGEINLEELKELIAKDTRNYAKRQLTFFRGFKNAKWFNPLTEKEEIFEYIKKELV